ncbi:MAG: hypothetical protein QOF39_628 [Frankiales bacterium]|nr:hypothetical protein [Frankiales bacterium]
MYSLVSPSVLCMDLVRHDNALGILDVLDRAITLGPADVAALESVHRDDDARDRAWAEVERVCGDAPKLSDAVAAVRQTIADAGFDSVIENGFADKLSRTPMFGLPHLLSMVRNDVLDWTWERSREISVCRNPHAAAVVVDAVAAAYVRDRISVQSYARLGGPWSGLHFGVPTALPGGEDSAAFGPQSRRLRDLVEQLARLTAADFLTLEQIAGAARTAGTDWSKLMHNATWAAYMSGRLRPAARAQMAATRALLLAGLTPMAAATGVMRVVTGVVQAVVVTDLLDTRSYDELVSPWQAACGPLR